MCPTLVQGSLWGGCTHGPAQAQSSAFELSQWQSCQSLGADFSYPQRVAARGNKFKRVQHHCHYDLRKYNFTNRVIPIWNSLPDFVVSAGTTNTFKNRLDKFWSDQDILYDYKADLHGIGNRSVVY